MQANELIGQLTAFMDEIMQSLPRGLTALDGNLPNSKSSGSHRLFVTSTKIVQTYYILENANKPNSKSRKPRLWRIPDYFKFLLVLSCKSISCESNSGHGFQLMEFGNLTPQEVACDV